MEFERKGVILNFPDSFSRAAWEISGNLKGNAWLGSRSCKGGSQVQGQKHLQQEERHLGG